MNQELLKIIEEADIPESFWSPRRHSDGLEGVKATMESVLLRGDEGIRDAAAKFDRANPGSFEIPLADRTAAVARLVRENPDLYESACLSRDLALRFARLQRDVITSYSIHYTKLYDATTTSPTPAALAGATVIITLERRGKRPAGT